MRSPSDSDLPGVLRELLARFTDGNNPAFAVECWPMCYVATAELPALVERGGPPALGMREPEVLARIMRLGASVPDGSAHHHVDIIRSLLLYAAGAMDEAHNLVLPLSWPSPTAMGGRPVRGSAAAKDATYVHAMLHRQEGDLVGQEGGGMIGWDNAAFWFSQAGPHPCTTEVLNAARGAAAGHRELEALVRAHGNAWDSAEFLKLCRRAVASRDPELSAFCSRVACAEWSLLLRHSWGKAAAAGVTASEL